MIIVIAAPTLPASFEGRLPSPIPQEEQSLVSMTDEFTRNAQDVHDRIELVG